MEETLYMENILDHYKHPLNTGRIDDADFSWRELNPSCGDVVELFVKMDGGRVADVKFEGRGCAVSQASASMLTERLKGMMLADVRMLSEKDVLAMLGIEVGPLRMKCAILPLRALAQALEQRK